MRLRAFLFLVLILLVQGCQPVSDPPKIIIPEEEMNDTVESPIDLYLPDQNPKEGTSFIYYQLFSNGTRYWYYPMTGTSTGNQALHVQALNQTLLSICEALNLQPIVTENIKISQAIAELDLPDSFTLGLPSLNAVRSVGDALVMTLTEFSTIERVQFLIDGKNGNFLSRNSAQYEINLPVSRPKWPNEETLKQENKAVVYWRIPNTENLIPLTIRLQHSDNLSLQALEILLQGPQNYAPTFWPSTLITGQDSEESLPLNSFSVHNRIAYLDLNCDSSIIDCSDERSSVAFRAIVQTLTEFSEIEKVQFLFKGKRVAVVNGRMNLGDPILRFLIINHDSQISP